MSCPGNSRITGVRTWYVPRGMTPRERTYCTYCYENKCMNADVGLGYVWPWQSSENSRVNCDCTAHKVKYDPLMCRKCRNSMRLMTADESECHNCSGYVHSSNLKYCMKCSHELEACEVCGEHVSPDNNRKFKEEKEKEEYEEYYGSKPEQPKPEQPKPEEPKPEEPKPEEPKPEEPKPEEPKPEEPKPEEPKPEEPKPNRDSDKSDDEVEDLVQCQII